MINPAKCWILSHVCSDGIIKRGYYVMNNRCARSSISPKAVFHQSCMNRTYYLKRQQRWYVSHSLMYIWPGCERPMWGTVMQETRLTRFLYRHVHVTFIWFIHFVLPSISSFQCYYVNWILLAWRLKRKIWEDQVSDVEVFILVWNENWHFLFLFGLL